MLGKYNHLMNTHFSGCVLLAQGQDVHRNRTVKIYALPSNDEYVGVTDGTDSWIAPVSADPLHCDLRQIILDMHNGVAPVIKPLQPAAPAASGRVRKVSAALVTAPVPTEVRARKRPAMAL